MRPGGKLLVVALLGVGAFATWRLFVPRCDSRTPVLRLPFPGDVERPVMQGAGGAWSHNGGQEWAWDFEMPPGTPVLAAAPGRVVEVVDGFDEGGPHLSLAGAANAVVIDHGNNRFSQYFHLSRGGMRVKEGDEVARGQELGLSGNSGFTTGPHLHFAVTDETNRTQPVCFCDVDGDRPEERRRYRASVADPRERPQRTALSLLPRDVFSEGGVELTVDLPTRWLASRSPVHLEGRAKAGRRVLAFVAVRSSSVAARTLTAEVDAQGLFRLDLDWRGLEGPCRVSMVVPADDGSYFTTVSVPVNFGTR